jgi:hypothetical protein
LADDHKTFSRPVQRQALERQKFRCASCKVSIAAIGEAGVDQHRFGEGAQAHHVIPHKEDGPLWVSNCVVICRSCHYSAHQGGRWGDVSIYADLKGLAIAQKIARISALYPHYNG